MDGRPSNLLARCSRGRHHLLVESRPALLPELVEGTDLVLRAWRPDDVDDLAEAVARNVEHLRPWMPWIAHERLTPAARLELIAGWSRERDAGGDVVFGAFQDGQVVGGTGLHRRRGPSGLEIGYWVDADHTSREIATEMARLLTTAAFEVPGVSFVEIHNDRANVASGRVPAKLGYTSVGEAPAEITAPGQVGVDCTWRVLAADWEGGR